MSICEGVLKDRITSLNDEIASTFPPKRVSKNELPNLLKVKRFSKIVFEHKKGRTELRLLRKMQPSNMVNKRNHASIDL